MVPITTHEMAVGMNTTLRKNFHPHSQQEQSVVLQDALKCGVLEQLQVGAGADPGARQPVPVGHAVVDRLAYGYDEQQRDQSDGRRDKRPSSKGSTGWALA